MIVYLRCYRDYTTGAADSPDPGLYFSLAVARAAAHAPSLTNVIASIASLFACRSGATGLTDAIRRFHQLSAPVAAVAVEDTAFYRFGRLLSRNDVGFDPRTHATSLPSFHNRMHERALRLPGAMLTTATHDHKRGEDGRARLAVLSEKPAEWAAFIAATPSVPGIDPADCYILYQTLVGAWPDGGSDDSFAERIESWCEKYLREAKRRSSWTAPNTAYEKKFRSFARELLLSPDKEAFRIRLSGLLDVIAPMACVNTLVQVALRCTLPGVPDLYQGCEFDDYSLVDPDNRRPIDFTSCASVLKRGSNQKQSMIAKILLARRRDPTLWSEGDYCGLEIDDSLVAFSRSHAGSRLLVFARRHSAQQCPQAVVLLDRTYNSILEGADVSPGQTDIGRHMSVFPVAIFHAPSSSYG
jgi:(1->4)-alpha-D-glucan 1-alpha-D-glucosylmutase